MINSIANFLTTGFGRGKTSRSIMELAYIEYKYEAPEYIEYLVKSGQIYKNKIDKQVI